MNSLPTAIQSRRKRPVANVELVVAAALAVVLDGVADELGVVLEGPQIAPIYQNRFKIVLMYNIRNGSA